MNHEIQCPLCNEKVTSDNIKMCPKHINFLLTLITEPDENIQIDVKESR
jgi:hypothetical protein